MAEESKEQVEPGKSPAGSNQPSGEKPKAGSQTDIIALSKALDKARKENRELREQLSEKGDGETPKSGLFGNETEEFQRELGKLKGYIKQRDLDIHQLNLQNKALKVSHEYGIPLEALEGEENPEAKVLEILAQAAVEEAEAKAKAKEEGAVEEGSKPIYEVGVVPPVGKTPISGMSREEFKKYAEDLEHKYNISH